ncbi:unnamed protein product, partial [Mesorhabditis belari]|uniref:Uncharacterized protein n=1 Tax=Mesorhabditis belari TaxID=2138241 RepID=A0A915F9L4_9BILA
MVELRVERIPEDYIIAEKRNPIAREYWRKPWMPLVLVCVVCMGVIVIGVVASIIIASNRLSDAGYYRD